MANKEGNFNIVFTSNKHLYQPYVSETGGYLPLSAKYGAKEVILTYNGVME